MEYPATTEAQKRAAIAWITSGFESYGERIDPDPKIRRYGEEFGRILYGNVGDSEIDLPQLRQDLLRLIDKQCLAGDVVELVVRCTSETNVALSCGVQSCDITERDLLDLEYCIRQAADGIHQLRRSSILRSLSPESLLFIPNLSGGAVEAVEQARHHLKNVSWCTDSIAERLSHYRLASDFPYSSFANAFLKNSDLFFLYTMLKLFHCGYPTLSRLLKAMRRVRYIVEGDPEFLGTLSRKGTRPLHTTGRPKSEVRDPFSHHALQRRMNRFLRVDVTITDSLKKCVKFYYSDDCVSRRRGRETLVQFCDKIWERLERGRKRQETANSQTSKSTRTMPGATMFAPVTRAGTSPKSSPRPRTPNGLIHRV